MLLVLYCIHAMTSGLVNAWHVKSTQVQLFLQLQIQLLLLLPVRWFLAVPPTKMGVVGRRVSSVLASCRDCHPTALSNTGPRVGFRGFLNQLKFYVTFTHFSGGESIAVITGLKGSATLKRLSLTHLKSGAFSASVTVPSGHVLNAFCEINSFFISKLKNPQNFKEAFYIILKPVSFAI